MRCLVVLNTRSPGIGDGLTYETGGLPVVIGSLVLAPLRKKSIEGIVVDVTNVAADTEETFTPRRIEQVIGTQPLLTPEAVEALWWVAEYYHCSLRSALTPFVPAAPWRNAAMKETMLCSFISEPAKPGVRQKVVLDFLREHGPLPRDALRRKTSAASATIRSLTEKGYIKEERTADIPPPVTAFETTEARPLLSPKQKRVCDMIAASEKPSLLFGITGSGKTEIYASLIADAAAQGKQSILLVPEILLTEYTVHRFRKMFAPERIAVIHSRLTSSARRNAWMRIRSGSVALIIGSRSALFSPCARPGLIIIDEEHEWTYKNEQTPRYNARDLAEKLCSLSGAKLVLGSATPSLEAWARAKQDHYTLARLPERYMQRALPVVRVIDLGTVRFGSLYPFSPPLIQAIEERLARKEQTVLFLNRRGVASAMLCLQCRKRLVSPVSQLPYTVHRGPDNRMYLLDHVAGVSAEVPAECPHCRSTQLLPVGAGTQKLENILSSLFPTAKILRADSDTLQHPEQMRQVLDDMRERRADILLGTQSVVKGLDLPMVTLAAVLVADIGLSLPHFRAGERVFQLLTQLTGRSGRAGPGDVYIQTFRPDAPEVQAAAAHRTEEYLETELTLRTLLNYPPSVPMIRLLITGEKAEPRARSVHQAVLRLITHLGVEAQATVAPTLFGIGLEWHVLIKGNDIHQLLAHIPLTDVTVDVDPMDVV